MRNVTRKPERMEVDLPDFGPRLSGPARRPARSSSSSDMHFLKEGWFQVGLYAMIAGSLGLDAIWGQRHFPAFHSDQLNPFAIGAGFVIGLVFTVMQFLMWEHSKSPWALAGAPFLAVSIIIDLDSLMFLLGVPVLDYKDWAWFVILMGAAGLEIAPELIMTIQKKMR